MLIMHYKSTRLNVFKVVWNWLTLFWVKVKSQSRFNTGAASRRRNKKILEKFNRDNKLKGDEIIDGKILDLLCNDNPYINNYRVIMSDDMENCYNKNW